MLIMLFLATVIFQKADTSSEVKKNLYLLGMFPTFPKQPMDVIGMDCLLSARLALRHVNENPDILSDFNLKMIEIDTVVSQHKPLLPLTLNKRYIISYIFIFIHQLLNL